MYLVSIYLEFFACITGADVLKKVSINERDNGGACVQQGPIRTDDVSL